jgi:hypothetical protein
MMNSVFFATFDPLLSNAPDACALCLTQPPAFSYEYCNENDEGERKYLNGFCCSSCAGGLLKKMANAEASQWEAEEAVLEAESVDVTDLQKRRLATFGSK